MNRVRPLAQVTIPARFGGKACNLKRVMDMGLAVPTTFVLETAALTVTLSDLEMEGDVDRYVASDADEESYRRLCRRIGDSTPSSALSDEIASLARELEFPWVVRSSAAVEDSAAASFAGVFESRVGIRTVEEAEVAIKAVWCSLWAPRAVRYSRATDVAAGRDGMAVMLQALVPADYAGVMYTADRGTGNPGVIEIHAVEGLAVDLMSGSGEGTAYRVDWQSDELLDQVTDGAGEARLPTASLQRLTAMARRVDRLFGRRMDIEWAIAGDEAYIVQARPLTALPAFFPAEPPDERTWRCPLLVVPLRKPGADNLIVPLYDDMDEQELWFRHHRPGMTLTGPVVEYVDILGHRYGHESEHPTFIDYCNEHGWDKLEPWVRDNEPYYYSRWRHHTAEIETIIEDAQAALNRITEAREMFEAWRDIRDRTFDLISFGWSAPQAMGWMFEALLARFMREERVDYDRGRLLVGGEGSATFRFSRDLQALARSPSATEEAVRRVVMNTPLDEILSKLRRGHRGSELLSAFEALCWRYGKFPFGWEQRPPFWRPDDAALYPLLQSIRATMDGSAADVVESQRQAADQAEAYRRELRAAVGDKEKFDWIVERGRIWTQALNDRHEVNAAFLYEKEVAWRLGELLVRSGVMETPEQVLALPVEDLERLFGMAPDGQSALVTLRWQTYEFHARLTAPVELGKRTDEEMSSPPSSEEPASEFAGQGMSGKRVTGRLRIVRNLQDPAFLDSLERQDILVLLEEHAFFYADWHSILTMVGGVVSRGRPSHHLSQVARECDVAVLGYVEGNLESIPELSRADLDPAAGTLRILASIRH